jgi:DNA-nicking Smr family endonuclease
MAKPSGGEGAKPLLGDASLWWRAMEEVTPLKRSGRAPKPAPVFPPAPAKAAPAREATGKSAPRPLPALSAKSAPGLDGATHDRLKRGQLPIDGKLDLHGMDRVRAHRALVAYVENAAAQGKRCVLVVTGKGGAKPGEAGVLKAETPRWLNEAALRPLVLAIAPAQPRHGGGGALYVYLRRRR